MVSLACGVWSTIPLEDFAFLSLSSGAFPGPYGQLSDGVIWTVPLSLGGGRDGFPDFYLPGLVLEPTVRSYDVEVTFSPGSGHDAGGRSFWLSGIPAGGEMAAYDAIALPFGNLYDGTGNTADVASVTIGPGVNGWDAALTDGLNNLWFETDGAGAVSQIRLRKNCAIRPQVPPLRQYPRSDGLGASSARRMYPPAPSVQASNRQAGGYL